MYIRKTTGPRMHLSATQASIRHLLGIPIQNHMKLSINEKWINRSKNLTKNSASLKFVKKSPCEILSRTFYISTATAQGAPKMFWALKVPSTTIAKNSAVKGEDLIPYQKSEKILQSSWSTSLSQQVSDRFC